MKQQLYCVKCKTRQPSGKMIVTATDSGRPYVKCRCPICGINRTRFIKKEIVMPFVGKKGGSTSLMSKFINALPFEAHLRDLLFDRKGLAKIIPRLQKYSFCGPGTKLDRRLKFTDYKPKDATNPELRKAIADVVTPPVNALDTQCMYHDVAYKYFKDTKGRNQADALLSRTAGVESSNAPHLSTRLNSKLVKKVMDFKVKKGIGMRGGVVPDRFPKEQWEDLMNARDASLIAQQGGFIPQLIATAVLAKKLQDLKKAKTGRGIITEGQGIKDFFRKIKEFFVGTPDKQSGFNYIPGKPNLYQRVVGKIMGKLWNKMMNKRAEARNRAKYGHGIVFQNLLTSSDQKELRKVSKKQGGNLAFILAILKALSQGLPSTSERPSPIQIGELIKQIALQKMNGMPMTPEQGATLGMGLFLPGTKPYGGMVARMFADKPLTKKQGGILQKGGMFVLRDKHGCPSPIYGSMGNPCRKNKGVGMRGRGKVLALPPDATPEERRRRAELLASPWGAVI